MSAQWLCLIDNQQYGPFPWETLQQFVQDRRLAGEDYIRREDDQQWYFASQFPELFPQPAATAPAAKPAPSKPKAKSAKPARAKAAAAKPAAAKPAAGKGSAVAKKPAVAKPQVARQPAPAAARTNSPIPVGTPMATGASAPTGTAVAAAPTTASTTDDDLYAGRKSKSRQQTLVVGGLLGAIGLMIVIAVVVFATTGGDNAADQVALDETSPAENPVVETPVEANPESNPVDLEANPAAATPGAESTEPRIADTSADVLAATIHTVHTWRDASRQRAGLKGVARIHVDAAWLEADSSGDERVGLELHVKNMASDAPLTFVGWSAEDATPNRQAVLVDDAGRLLPLVERSATASATSNIAAGAVLETRLYFAAPVEDYQFLKIAIPYAAVGRTGFIGYQIPKVMLAANAPSEMATESAAKTAHVPRPVSTPSSMVAAPAGEPNSINDLKNSIEQSRSNPAAQQGNTAGPRAAKSVERPANNTEPASIDELRKAIEAGRSNDADR